MSAPILLEDAWAQLFALARPLGTESVPVDDGASRYLARALAARRTQPAVDLSAMDGFAVAGPGPWRIAGEARAGTPLERPLRLGEAARISTGAACPAGTDGIVLREDARIEGAALAAEQVEPGRWIRRRGFDFTEGAALLKAGTRIGPAQIALARAAGHAALDVARQPRLTIIECGDELVADTADCPPDRLPASNGAMVAAMATDIAHVRRIGPLPDDRAALVRALVESEDADVIVTTAGASAGEHDHVRGAIEDWGAELAFWRVSIRPGKPLLVAHRPGGSGRQIVLGLPGNPASSYVTAFLLLLPLLRALQGATLAAPVAVALPLAEPLPPGGERREFRRARLVDGQALPISERDSSALRALAAADLLIDRPIDAGQAPAGTLVPCLWLGYGGMA